MKTDKIAPWVFFCIAMLVFVILILLTCHDHFGVGILTILSLKVRLYSLQVTSSSLPSAHAPRHPPKQPSSSTMTTGILPSSHRSGSRLPCRTLSGRMAPPRMAPSYMQGLST